MLLSGTQVTCLVTKSMDEEGIRIVVRTRQRTIQLTWQNEDIKSIFSIELDVTIPICANFANSQRKDLQVFGLYNGAIHLPDGEGGCLKLTITLDRPIGSAAVNRRGTYAMIDNVQAGFSLYRLETGTHAQGYSTKPPQKGLLKQTLPWILVPNSLEVDGGEVEDKKEQSKILWRRIRKDLEKD
ncbi:hypothetical protein SERLA73DRAFT_150257 [Serpula lacrymans var. lacrymans S7.3]|uniref:Uncharacterized protein n=1 Tax=Serpula lacrymans var. lacrymans (strain S7.3) TaxID=936435 RepID=F8PLS8_SERL3|nr:hypothetical protein SERLA73DRAFT_150257 [Serpula lacrymans var. lacrymans S7.3]